MVPRSDLLFENGLTETSTEGQRSFDLPETLIRFGLSSKTELRFTVPDYFQNFNMGRGPLLQRGPNLTLGVLRNFGRTMACIRSRAKNRSLTS